MSRKLSAGKNKKKGNHRKNDFSDEKGMTRPEISKDPTNNPAWYAPSGQIIKDVASLAYGYPTGGKQNLGEYTPELNKYGTPGIMSLFFTPTFGASTDFLSPLNIAARDMYSFVRHANSGHANYDAPDLMLYILALDQVYMWLAHIRRLYKCLRTHSYENKYYAYGLVRAAGGDYDDLVTHMSELRAFINVAYARAGAFALPKTISLIDRHQQVCSHVYCDSSDEKAQLYLLRPRTVYVYGYDDDGAGGLTEIWNISGGDQATYFGRPLGISGNYHQGLTALTGNPSTGSAHKASTTQDIFDGGNGNYLTFEQIKSITNTILTKLEGVEDIGIISGDILKAYGIGQLWGFTELKEDEIIQPLMDPAMLMQIQNASLMGYFCSNPIVQDETKQFLIQNTECRTPYKDATDETTARFYAPNAFLADRYLNVDLRDVTPIDTMEATRLMNIGTSYESASGRYEVNTCGSEIVEFAIIFRYDYSRTGKHRLWASRAITTSLANMFKFNASDTLANVINKYCEFTEFHNTMNLISNFEFHPAVYCTQVFTSGGSNPSIEAYSTFDSVAFDLNKYTIVGPKELEDMSNAAIQALLGISV